MQIDLRLADLTMSRYRKADLDNAQVFDPESEDYKLDTKIPEMMKVSDYVIGILKIAYHMKLVPRAVLTRVELTFTANLRIRQFASGHGKPLLDSKGRAVLCEGTILRGHNMTLKQSPYTVKTILMDVKFKA